MNKSNTLPQVQRLKYKKGELILKEGNFGNSIYLILEGQVRIFIKTDDGELTLTTLGQGEVFGEVAFFNRTTDPNPTSALALEDSEFAVWHMAKLLIEYETLPPIFRYIVNQSFRRLLRTRRLIAELAKNYRVKIIEKKAKQRREWAAQQRRHYRKEVELNCFYRPLSASPNVRLEGVIRDISQSGIGLEVPEQSLKYYTHDVGDKFQVDATLPNDKKLSVTVLVVSTANMPKIKGNVFLGTAITDISYENQKTLGFYLMP